MRAMVDAGRWREAPWYREEATFVDHFITRLPECRLFVDCGMEVGFFSYLAVKLMPSGGRVIGFEPDGPSHAALIECFADCPQVVIHRQAVSNKAGSATLTSVVGRPCGTLAEVGGRGQSCETVTLDDVLIDEKPDILKIDIEGHEAAAIAGAQQLLRVKQPTIYLESHPAWINEHTPNGLSQMERLFREQCYFIHNADHGQLVRCGGLWGRNFVVSRKSEGSSFDLRVQWQRAKQFIKSLLRK